MGNYLSNLGESENYHIDSIYNKSIKELSSYVDPVCVSRCTDLEFLKDQINKNKDGEECFSKWNISSLGNVAYLSLNAPCPYNQYYSNLLKSFKNWKKNGGIVQ